VNNDNSTENNVIIGTWVYVTHTTEERRENWLGQWAVVSEVNTIEQTEGDGGTVTDYTLIRPVAGQDFDRAYGIPREAFKPIRHGSVVYANSERVNPGFMWVVCAFTGPTSTKQVSLLQVSWLQGEASGRLQTAHSTTPTLHNVSGLRNVEPMAVELTPSGEAVSEVVGQAAAYAVAVRDTAMENYSRVTREHDEWKERVTARLHEVADDNQWCDAFDTEMESFGLRPRLRQFNVEVAVTIEYITVSVEATSEEAAISQVDDWESGARDEAIREWVSHNDAYWDAKSAERSDD
jgi:hypothetical protein